VTVTVTGSQTISSIALSNSGTTTGLASGTAVGTLSVTLSPMTPTFSYSGTNLHLSASGADSGGVCNSTNGAGNGSFQILNGDTLATNGAITVGNKAICVTASQGAVSATGHAFTIAVGNRIDAAASFCAANGGGNGTTGSPWTTPCIVAAFNQAVNGDTVFLQAGEWMLSTDSGIAAQTGKSINLIGAGSGNTFDVYGHPNNGKGSGTGVVTHIYQNGTQLQAGVNPNFSGYIQFGLDAFQRGTACASNNSSTVAHIFFDGSQSTDGGAQWALLNTNHCPGIDFNDIRVWSWRCAGSPCSISGDIANPETQFFPWFNSNNVTVENSVMSDPPYLDVNGGYAGGQILQTQEHSFNTAKNNIFYQNQANPFFADNYTFTGNQTYEYTDGFGHANVPPAMGFAGCGPSPCGYSGQSFSPNDSVLNSLFYAIGNFMSIGGAVNDVGGGAITNTHMSGNWLIANDAYLQTCEWNHVLFGYCGPGVNPSQGEQVNQLSFTNNSLKATHSATIDLTGPGVAGGVTLTCNTCVAQHNWASTPSISNSALSDANSISPTLNSNFGWDVTSGFTTSPTVSFKLGPLGLNGVVPFTSTNFTAQYGAVQWLASTSSTPPLSSDARWTSNNGSFPANGSNVTYVPPVSLSGVTHGTTVYMWVMDSANHISATASQVIP
jgi:hypothetical protein